MSFDERGTEEDPRQKERRRIAPLSEFTRSEFIRPRDVGGLLAATIEILLRDDRVAEDVAARAPAWVERRDAESARTWAERSWRWVLPTVDSGDMRTYRIRFGWAVTEVRDVWLALFHVQNRLVEMAGEKGLLSGTRETLLRDAERITPTLHEWLVLWDMVAPGESRTPEEWLEFQRRWEGSSNGT